MMVGPPGAIIQRTVEQPPPEKTVVRIAVNHHRTCVIWIEDIVNAHRTRADGDGVRDVGALAIGASRGNRDWRWFGGIGIGGRGRAREISLDWRLRRLRFFETREFGFADLPFFGASCGGIVSEA